MLYPFTSRCFGLSFCMKVGILASSSMDEVPARIPSLAKPTIRAARRAVRSGDTPSVGSGATASAAAPDVLLLRRREFACLRSRVYFS